MKKLFLVMSLLVLGGILVVAAACAGPVGPAGPAGPAGSAGPAGPGVEPMTREIFADIYHHDSYARPAGIEAGLPEHEKVTTLYIWKTPVLYAFEGDTVKLTVMNNAGSRVHGLAIPELGVDTGQIMPRTPDNLPLGQGHTKTVTFVADKAGTYKFVCNTPFDLTQDPIWCSPDHVYQYGYFIVLDR